MKVENMTSSRGNKIANQFIISNTEHYFINGQEWEREIEVFQSYDSVIAKKFLSNDLKPTQLDEKYWNYSVTTSKYRDQFLGETKKETQSKIDSGEYQLVDLN